MSVEYRIGDVFDRMAEIPDGSIDVIITSPPFLALRSYLPADHPDKGKEIGSESNPAAFLDTLLALSAEFGRVLAPHGSICVELGDTFSGSGGAGGDYNDGGLRTGQSAYDGSAKRGRSLVDGGDPSWRQGPNTYQGNGHKQGGGSGWPLPKSLTGIPTLYPWSLAYGRNLLTGQDSPAGQWRIRNVIVWARPNPPVGALGDKFRPATSYITIACRSPKRFFDLDAVRTEPTATNGSTTGFRGITEGGVRVPTASHPAGAPPLDWHTDLEDGDWLWKLSTQPYRGAHYATFPLELPTRLIKAMCPLRVCVTCGKPSERITGEAEYVSNGKPVQPHVWQSGIATAGAHSNKQDGNTTRTAPTLGWSDCGHNDWRTGIVLDPFCGSGTTLEAAQNVGRHAIGIDLDPRNAELATSRVGMFLTTHT